MKLISDIERIELKALILNKYPAKEYNTVLEESLKDNKYSITLSISKKDE